MNINNNLLWWIEERQEEIAMEIKYVSQTAYGTRKYQCVIDDNKCVYFEFFLNSTHAGAEFVVGLIGGTEKMTHKESQNYRLGIEGHVGAYTGKKIDIFNTSFEKYDAVFADFYTVDGELIKKLVNHDDKFYMFDGTAYYEVTSDAKQIDEKSTETFVAKDESHMYAVPPELIAEKEKYEKIFSEIFETLRQPKQ